MTERVTAEEAVAAFSALSQSTRLEALRLLLRYYPFGLAAGDISRLLAVPHNTLSTHMATLQAAGLVQSRREGRRIIFAACPAKFTAVQAYLQQGTEPIFLTSVRRENSAYPAKRPEMSVNQKTYNVLILCTGNSARSILAEAIINREGAGRFKGYSAGSQPKGEPNPVGLELLKDLGYDTSEMRSKSWTEFAGADAPQMDFVITVCDSAAGEACPYWPGHPLVAHWGIPDPADVAGTHGQKLAAFQDAYRRLMSRVTALLNLPIDDLSLAELKARLQEIGKMDGATELALAGTAA